jgi:UDP-N-acetylglucosamine--N-acetylmuramyl-(pentapeptide) pyrophosphoryl-undecaprenol N-acetylglucosamine transferase
MERKRTIVLTGGGSAGHVIPNIALIPQLVKAGWSIAYIGSISGIEREIIESLDNSDVQYYPISTGKLRRYIDMKNLKDPFRVLRGVAQSYRLLLKIRPAVIFSKGGFVSVPVIIGSWLNRIPVIIHESDMTPGLANRISIPFASKVCVTFPETLKHLPKQKAEYTGSPIRADIVSGQAKKGRERCGFHTQLPILMVMGGSLGSQSINQRIRDNLDVLLPQFQIIHICGKGNIDEQYIDTKGYRQFEYINEGLPDILAMVDIVVSRAGANSIFEFLALKKPMLLIPLSLQASRGDQILNAQSFEKMGYCRVLYEEDISQSTLYQAIIDLYNDRSSYVTSMEQSKTTQSVNHIITLIEHYASKS